MKLCTSFGTRLGAQVRDFSARFGFFTKWDRTTSWYLEISSSLVFNLLEEYMEDIFSLRVSKNISLVSAPFELFYDEFKVKKCCTQTFCLCWVLRIKAAFMRCVNFLERSQHFWIIHEKLIRACLRALSIQPKIPEIPVGSSNRTDHFGLVRPEYSGPALKVVLSDRSGHFGRSDRNVPFHLPKLLFPVPLFCILRTRTSSFHWKVKYCEQSYDISNSLNRLQFFFDFWYLSVSNNWHNT